MKQNSFTLVESIVVLVIIGIFVAMAIPTYVRTIEAGRGKAARSILQAICAAEREHCVNRGTYANLGDLVAKEYIADPNDPDQTAWQYGAVWDGDSGPNTCGAFDATARRATGQNAGEEITIDEAGVLGGDFTP